MEKNNTYNVKEYIIDFFGCRRDLSNPDIVSESISVLKRAAESVGAHVKDIHCTTYTIHGFTTVALLAESHIIITAWPEYNYVSTNIYLCNSNMDHNKVFDILKEYVQASNYQSSWFRHLSLPNNNLNVFLAAPFTSFINNKNEGTIFSEIKKVYKLLEKSGYTVFSAHERESYGKKLMSPSECTYLDYIEMEKTDVVIALISEDSFGVSLELGWASALNKKIILYSTPDKSFSSPLIEGLKVISDVEVVYDIDSLMTILNNYLCVKKLNM